MQPKRGGCTCRQKASADKQTTAPSREQALIPVNHATCSTHHCGSLFPTPILIPIQYVYTILGTIHTYHKLRLKSRPKEMHKLIQFNAHLTICT